MLTAGEGGSFTTVGAGAALAGAMAASGSTASRVSDSAVAARTALTRAPRETARSPSRMPLVEPVRAAERRMFT